jgi:leucyl-tRNA synthetase
LAEELWAKLRATQVAAADRSAALAAPGDGPGLSKPASALWEPHLAYLPWPKFDPSILIESILEIPVQVNGKLRDVIRVSATATPAEIEAAAREAEKARPFLNGKTVRKVIVVPKKLVNLVVG